MAEVIEISREAPAQESKIYALLREKAILHLQKIAGEVWTDHNLHDPGITLLELVCYAITELGHKGQLDIKDLLASAYPDGSPRDFYPARDILTMNPLTIDDFRKVLIDIPGIRNAWLNDAPRFRPKFYYRGDQLVSIPSGDPYHSFIQENENEQAAIKVDGLYEVQIEFDEDKDLKDLNESVLDKTITPDTTDPYPEFTYAISFPFLDEKEVSYWQQELSITKVEVQEQDGQPGVYFLETDTKDFFFIDLMIDHTLGSDCWRLGVKVTSLADLTPSVLGQILPKVKDDLYYLSGNPAIDFLLDFNHLVRYYNLKVIKVHELLHTVRCKLSSMRNLCEDFMNFGVTRIQEVALRANIEVATGTDIETLLAEIFFEVHQFLSPAVKPHSLPEMQALHDASLTTEGIFEGPYLENGFIDTTELKAVPGFEDRSKIYTSDLINIILSLRNQGGGEKQAAEFSLDKNIISVSEFALSNFIDNQCITKAAVHCLQLVIADTYLPRFSAQKSQITFFRNNKEVPYSLQNVISLFDKLKANAAAELQFEPNELQLSLPDGQNLPIETYFSIQEHLPIFYGVGSAGLPDTASAGQKAKAKQLQGYLFFFEQLLANQLAQLSHIREFFSINDRQDRTYFFQTLYQNPGVQLLLKEYVEVGGDWEDYAQDPDNQYIQHLLCDTESKESFLDRRSRMLDHQMARYSEDMLDYAISRYGLEMKVQFAGDIDAYRLALTEKRQQVTRRLLADKSCFLQDYVAIGQKRADAFDCLTCEEADEAFIRIRALAGPPASYQWELVNEDNEAVLESTETYLTEAKALEAAKSALGAARQLTFYSFGEDDFAEGVACGFYLYDGNPATGNLLAQSVKQNFPSSLAAQAAVYQLVTWFDRDNWDTDNRSGLELRLTKLLGMRSNKRRHLLSPLIAPPLLPTPYFSAGLMHAVRGNTEINTPFFDIKRDSPGSNEWRIILTDGTNELLQAPSTFTQISTPSITTLRHYNKVKKWIKYGVDPANYDGSQLKDGSQVIAEIVGSNDSAKIANFLYHHYGRFTYFEVEKDSSNQLEWRIELKAKASLDGSEGTVVLLESKKHSTKPDPLDYTLGSPFQTFFTLSQNPANLEIITNSSSSYSLVLKNGTTEISEKENFSSLKAAEVARDNILNLVYARYTHTTYFDVAQVAGDWRLRLHNGTDTILSHEGPLISDEIADGISQKIITYGLKRCHYHIDTNNKISLYGLNPLDHIATYEDAFGTPASRDEAENIIHQIINFLLIHYGRPAFFEVGPKSGAGDEEEWRLRVKDSAGQVLLTAVREADDDNSIADRAREIATREFFDGASWQPDHFAYFVSEPTLGEFVLNLGDASMTAIIASQEGFSSEEAALQAKDSLLNFFFAHYGRKGFFKLDFAKDQVTLHDEVDSQTSVNELLALPLYSNNSPGTFKETYPLTDLAYLLKVSSDFDNFVVHEKGVQWELAIVLQDAGAPYTVLPIETFSSEDDAKAALASWEDTSLFLCEHFGQKAFFEFAPLDGHWKLQLVDKEGNPLLYSAHSFTDEASLQDTLKQIITLGTSPANYCIGADRRVALGIFQPGYDPKSKVCSDKMEVTAYLSDFYPTQDSALDAIDATVEFLSEAYSGEGFHLIEHLLLRPTVEDPCDPLNGLPEGLEEHFLSIPGKNQKNRRDPYSFQVTIILPNGCLRDVRKHPNELTAHLPAAFLDSDYRNFVERMIRRETPAHILPHIVWIPDEFHFGVDKIGQPVSLKKFERLYKKWLSVKEAVARRGTDTVRIVSPLDIKRIKIQNNLVDMLNLMYQG